MIRRNVLWIDCIGAGIAGVAMLALSGWLSRLYGLTAEFVVALGVVNLIYGAFSFSLALQARRPRPLITLLVLANGTWGLICLAAAVLLASQATLFGLGHLAVEGLYVAWLARVEWSLREQLIASPGLFAG